MKSVPQQNAHDDDGNKMEQQHGTDQERDRRMRPVRRGNESHTRSRSISPSSTSGLTPSPTEWPNTPGGGLSPLTEGRYGGRYDRFNLRKKTKKSLYIKALLNRLKLEVKS